MLNVERASHEDAYEITRIKTSAYNKEINTYLGRNGGPSGSDKVELKFDYPYKTKWLGVTVIWICCHEKT